MIIDENTEPIDLRAGVYKHYKGSLYQVMGYSHNASDNNQIQVLYIGLELDPEKPGPRFATYNWREFFETVCPIHYGIEVYGPSHEQIMRNEYDIEELSICAPERWVERFTYMSPVYYIGFES